MKLKSVFLNCLPVLFLFACTESREDKLNKIKTLEEKFYTATQIIPNDTTADELIRMYYSFANTYPKDTLAPAYIFKAGEISNGIKKYEQSLLYFKEICDEYPEHGKAPYAWFFRGFIYENMLSDTSAARQSYSSFLQKFPNHQLAHDVSFALKNMGRSSLEIIREFEKANKEFENP